MKWGKFEIDDATLVVLILGLGICAAITIGVSFEAVYNE